MVLLRLNARNAVRILKSMILKRQVFANIVGMLCDREGYQQL